jgi:dTDP-4-dehydrorhamnose reductase
MKKILVTGGDSRFAKNLKKIKSKYKFIYTNKKQIDILDIKSIKKKINQIKPNYVLHLAGLSRPMIIHEKKISKSIDLNIIGTCNLVKICSDQNIKLIYFSTSYVYPGKKGNYKENEGIFPWNNYGWSKMGGECAVQMYKNSLILRICMTEKPFVHKKAFANVKTNFMYHDDVAKIFMKLLNKKGIINLGGKPQSIYAFVKKNKKNIKKIYSDGKFPLNQTMNLSKLKNIIKNL